MNQVKTGEKPRILVAPLDWGLGHATRCIPLVRSLLQAGAEPWLAGEGAQELLLRREFPELPFLSLAGYRVQYGRSAAGLTWQMIRQVPKLKKSIRAEHSWLETAAAEFRFAGIISDNRYGLYHRSVPSVIITHQLLIKTPLGGLSERILQHQNYRYLNRFSRCWVPDWPGKENLAGELAHPRKMPEVPVDYIGPLTRFNATKATTAPGAGKAPHLLFVLSGPEPQRTLLENKILETIHRWSGTATIVRGLPGEATHLPSTGMIACYNHLSAADLEDIFLKADFIISRSGYSTVMDAMALGKKCIFIPTPGQTEQEYLGRYLQDKGYALTIKQEEFSLEHALEQARNFSYRFPDTNLANRLDNIVSNWLASLSV